MLHTVEINQWSDGVSHIYETFGDNDTKCINRGGSPQDKIFRGKVEKTLNHQGYSLTKPGLNTFVYSKEISTPEYTERAEYVKFSPKEHWYV
jgi:hypothetical protein